ncbi:MAG: cupin domain-containing protein [Candidatus Eremiobacteraeota bacterium]|nr:cupin domain-containing protein [Candidatus Eremiobacteraeota bacterium]
MRIFSICLCLVYAVAQSAIAQTAAKPAIVGMKAMPVTVTAGSYQLINQVIDVPPGAAIPRHTHGGPAVVTMVSGALVVTDAKGTRTLKAGQTFTEPTGYVHAVANKGSIPARVSVSYLIPKGAQVTTMVK